MMTKSSALMMRRRFLIWKPSIKLWWRSRPFLDHNFYASQLCSGCVKHCGEWKQLPHNFTDRLPSLQHCGPQNIIPNMPTILHHPIPTSPSTVIKELYAIWLLKSQFSKSYMVAGYMRSQNADYTICCLFKKVFFLLEALFAMCIISFYMCLTFSLFSSLQA